MECVCPQFLGTEGDPVIRCELWLAKMGFHVEGGSVGCDDVIDVLSEKGERELVMSPLGQREGQLSPSACLRLTEHATGIPRMQLAHRRTHASRHTH